MPDATPNGNGKRSGWLSWDNAKWLVTVLAIPLALGWISERYQEASAAQQAQESRMRLYTELLSKREEADTSLRKDMFGKVLETFLKKGEGNLDQQIVAIELLALNFHESLNLSPLFRQIEESIRAQREPARTRMLNKLDRVATLVKDRQIEVLEIVGAKNEMWVSFAELDKGPLKLMDDELSFVEPTSIGGDDKRQEVRRTRHFTVEAMTYDRERRRLQVRVRLPKGETGARSLDSIFWVDLYDFPLVDFTRVSASDRFTLVQSRPTEEDVQLVFIYFPSSRSGVKDKPFIDEVVTNLLRDPGRKPQPSRDEPRPSGSNGK